MCPDKEGVLFSGVSLKRGSTVYHPKHMQIAMQQQMMCPLNVLLALQDEELYLCVYMPPEQCHNS